MNKFAGKIKSKSRQHHIENAEAAQTERWQPDDCPRQPVWCAADAANVPEAP